MKHKGDSTTVPLFYYSSEFFSNYLDSQLGRSKHTITSYRNCLRLLKTYIEESTGKCFYKFTFADASRDFFLKFLEWIEQRGCTRATRNQRLASIKTYAKYVMDCELELTRWGANVLSIPMVTAERKIVGWLREEALESIFKQPKDTEIGLRDKTLLVLMYECGARVSEILSLKTRDLNLYASGSSVRLHGKRRKIREIPIGKATTDLLKRYLNSYHTSTNRVPDGLVFFTRIHGKANKMSVGNVERIVTKYSEEARKVNAMVPQRVSPHMLRHTRATHLLRAKMPLPLIGRFLGHVNLETTNIYAACDVALLREAIENVEQSETNMQEESIWEENDDLLTKLCGL